MRFSFSGNLIRFVGFQKRVQIAAATVGEGITSLVNEYPDLKPVMLDGDGRVRRIHKMYFNDEAFDRTQTDRTVDEDDELLILTAIAGG